MAPLAPPATRTRVARPVRLPSCDRRSGPSGGPLTLAPGDQRGARPTLLDHHPEMLVFGEDVGRKGGVYGVTRGLQRRFGAGPGVRHAARRAVDPRAGARRRAGRPAAGRRRSSTSPTCTTPRTSCAARRPRCSSSPRASTATRWWCGSPAYAYQKGFGGHFHNDNAVAVLRDIPGLVVAVAGPARRRRARCCAPAWRRPRVDGSVCVFLEPIALYHERDLLRAGRRRVAGAVPGRLAVATSPIGTRRAPTGTARDLTIVTFGNGLRMCLRVAARLPAEGVGARVLDLRWLAPLPVEDMLREATATGRVLVVDETRRDRRGRRGRGHRAGRERVRRRASPGSRRRTASSRSAPAANLVLVQEEGIERAARTLLG